MLVYSLPPFLHFNETVIFLFLLRTLSNKLQGVDEATRRAQSFPVLLCHGKGKFMKLNIFVFLFVNKISRKKSVQV